MAGKESGSGLDGCRVLIIEDESLVSMFIEDTLADIGCTVVGVAAELEEALSKISALSFDVAVVDLNLNGTRTYPAAEALAHRRVPFVFSTGYGATGIPDAFRNVPIIQKPFQERDLQGALTKALSLHSPRSPPS